MNQVSYFEIGGELIELHADMQYGNGDITAKKRKQQRASARDVKSIGKSVDKMQKSQPKDGWGPAESIGYGLGLAAGIQFAVVTFPVVAADGPIIGPADLAWFAASIRFMQKSTSIGQKIGQVVDDQMGWE